MKLEINNNIVLIAEEDYKKMSEKDLFQIFWETDSKILYLVDANSILKGIITIGDFFKKLERKESDFVLDTFTTILLGNSEEEDLRNAERVLCERHITTAVPVVDDTFQICFEIREKATDTDVTINQYKEKLEKYEQSFYLKEEFVYLKRLLENQDILVVGTKCQLKNIFGNWIKDDSRISFIDQKIEDIYDFLYYREKLFIDLTCKEGGSREYIFAVCNNGYSWKGFINKLLECIELERFSRFYESLDNDYYTIHDFFKEYTLGKIEVDTNNIFYSLLKSYLKRYGISISRIPNLQRKESSWFIWKHANEEIPQKWGNLDIFIEIVSGILAYIQMNKLLDKMNPIINVYIGDKVNLSTEERRRFYSKGSLEDCNKNNEFDNLYSLRNDRERYKNLHGKFDIKNRRSFENDIIMMEDCNTSELHIENGIRRTLYQPQQYDKTVYLMGTCTIYGGCVEDSDTIPSILQYKINESRNNARVVNLGNRTPIQARKLINKLEINENDIFVIFWAVAPEKIRTKLGIKDFSEKFNDLRNEKYSGAECFLDMLSHCGFNGNLIISDIIYDEMELFLRSINKTELRQNNIYDVFKKDYSDLEHLYGFETFRLKLLELKESIPSDTKKIGCIVMNCNPFTAGHRYLIERALESVEYLYIFVVEEDKSYFSFEQRFAMVKQGTADLERVLVTGSGKTIASAVTLVQYFGTKYTSERQEEKISTVIDLRVFAQYIAPELNIKYRFVGEEPLDNITKQYNQMMKQMLPVFGVEIIEIPRKENERGAVISASKVRAAFVKGELERVMDMIPQSTYEYLLNLKKE